MARFRSRERSALDHAAAALTGRAWRIPQAVAPTRVAPIQSSVPRTRSHVCSMCRVTTAARSLAVARFEAPDHLFVLGHGVGPLSRLTVADVADALQPGLDRRVRRFQRRVARQLQESGVDLLVQLEIFEPVAHGVAFRHAVVDPPHPLDRRTARVPACKTCGERFEHREDVEHVAHVLRRELADDSAARGDQLDQAFAGEKLQCFTQRRPRHAERLPEMRFVHPAARREHPLDDHVAHARHDLVVQAAARDRLRAFAGGGGGNRSVELHAAYSIRAARFLGILVDRDPAKTGQDRPG